MSIQPGERARIPGDGTPLSPGGGGGYHSEFMTDVTTSNTNRLHDPRLTGVAVPTKPEVSQAPDRSRSRFWRKVAAYAGLAAVAAGAVVGVPLLIKIINGQGSSTDFLPNPGDLDGPGDLTIGGSDFEGPDPTGHIAEFNETIDSLSNHPGLNEAVEKALGVDSVSEDVLKVTFPGAGSAGFFSFGDDARTLTVAAVPLDSEQAKLYTENYPSWGVESTTDDRLPDAKVMYTGDDPEHPQVYAGEYVVIDERNGLVLVVGLFDGSQEEFLRERFELPGVENGRQLAGDVAAELRNSLLG